MPAPLSSASASLVRRSAPYLLICGLAIAARSIALFNPATGFDEQFYLLVGDRMLHGALPYVDIFDRKPIGLFLIFAAARLLGGAGFIAYKLVALGFVIATALAIRRIALPFASRFAATAAASFYILWLTFMEGEGGQSPIFYNLPVILAAGAVLQAVRRPDRVRARGVQAMIAIGMAMQIKYSAVIEGLFFGIVLIKIARDAGASVGSLAASAAIWIGTAIMPTFAAWGFYAGAGHASEFVFANFTSMFGQGREPNADALTHLAIIVGILAPLFLASVLGRSWRHVPATETGAFRFVLGWFAVSFLGMCLYWRFGSPHYGLPALLPLTAMLSPVLDAGRTARRASIGALFVCFGVGQAVLGFVQTEKGGAAEAHALAAAARPQGGCIYVYDGFPALYMLTDSCLPTRWPFPGHLNTRDEGNAAAIGIDPSLEVARIMRSRPTAVIADDPPFTFGNRATQAILQAALRRDYRLIACIRTGDRLRLVYRLRGDRTIAPQADCPALVSSAR